ncbi:MULTISPECIES: hypothetical protein [unclassified Okeania]|uniref:hypothetical protein n=1 Tax=unclassified Okeania TaxID=2634635 RepID=UPI0013BAE15B|nr:MULTISPECIES: hypothetical protein [unclassified Okeania]NES76504.1 hypothetical protein [Okeania sp. SIO1H4]NET17674.1 hypothetical protein [Okeania sp. SIO1H6]NET20370.1 hypothetical protein [Okeania sp. SIO1H5]NET94636.1 hypothetical protein [Okeania sp. SIO1H2]
MSSDCWLDEALIMLGVLKKKNYYFCCPWLKVAILVLINSLKKETGDRRQETGGKLHGDSHPK